MNDRRMIESVQAYGLRKVLSYLDSDPEKNIPKIIDWLIRVDKDDLVIGILVINCVGFANIGGSCVELACIGFSNIGFSDIGFFDA